MSEERLLRDRLETLQARRREQEELVAQGFDELAIQKDFEARTAELNDTRRRLEEERDRLEQELAQATEANARALQAQEASAPAPGEGRVEVVSGLFVGVASVAAAWLIGRHTGSPLRELFAAAPVAVAAVIAFLRRHELARVAR